jgi:hypothetical protein
MGIKVGLFSSLNSRLPWVPDNIFIVPGICFFIGINYSAKKPLTDSYTLYEKLTEERKGESRCLHVLFEFLGFTAKRELATIWVNNIRIQLWEV